VGLGQLGLTGTDSQGEQGFEADEARRRERLRRAGTRGTGKRAFWFVERDPIARRGVRLPRESAGVDETTSDKSLSGTFRQTGG
jgi:hypothetical protein